MHRIIVLLFTELIKIHNLKENRGEHRNFNGGTCISESVARNWCIIVCLLCVFHGVPVAQW